MKRAIHLIARVYAWLVKLYPASYRVQFEQEMVTLFYELMSDAAQKGLLALLVVCLREFSNLPENLINAHLSNRSGGARRMLQLQFDDQALLAARLGALGFGMGFAVINLSRYFLQALGLNNVGDFFTVWILGLGIVLYGIVGGLGGTLLGFASMSKEGPRGWKAWRLAVPSGVAGSFALALGSFATTMLGPLVVGSAASMDAGSSTPVIFVNIVKPLMMGALLTGCISIVQSARSFSFRRVVAGAVSFELGHIAGLFAMLFLGIAEAFLLPWLGLPASPPSDGLIRSVGVLVGLIEGAVSGALLGLVLGEGGTETPRQLAA